VACRDGGVFSSLLPGARIHCSAVGSHPGRDGCRLSDTKRYKTDTAKPVVRQGRKITDLLREMAGLFELFKGVQFEYQCGIHFYVEVVWMGKRSGVLMALGALALGVVAVSPTVSSAGTYNGAWSALPGVEGAKVFSYSLTMSNDWQAGNAFAMYSWENPNDKLILVDLLDDVHVWYVTISYKNDVYTASIQGGSWISLGAVPQFGFIFNNGNNWYTSYDLKSFEKGWFLTNSDTKSVISVQGDVQPVPIPGPVLLLSSGLFGLLGIGIRKNPASLV